jgi:hypothetical protein
MDALELARRFALGGAARLSDAPVARGKEGVVWRLETTVGNWAVKVPFHRTSESEVRLSTVFQEAAFAAGVPTPKVRRTTEGAETSRCSSRSSGTSPRWAATDWLHPNVRSPDRADSAAWIAESPRRTAHPRSTRNPFGSSKG